MALFFKELMARFPESIETLVITSNNDPDSAVNELGAALSSRGYKLYASEDLPDGSRAVIFLNERDTALAKEPL